MRSRILPLAAALALSSFARAQTKSDAADVNWGPELNDKVDGSFGYLFGQDKESIYALMSRKRETLVQRMDMNMKAVYQKPLELELDKKDMILEGLRVVGSNIIVFTSLFDKKEDQNNLYAKVYNAEDFSPKGRMEKIARITAEKSNNKGSFDVYVSPDDSKVMVEIEAPRERKKEQKLVKEGFIAKVFDADMNPIWDGTLSLPYLDNEFRRESVRIDNDGSVVMIGVKYADKAEARERKRDGQSTYGYHFVVFKNAQDEPTDFTVDVAGKFLQDMTVSLGESGDIICAGLYSEKGVRGLKGPFYMTLDRSTKSIKQQSFGEFSHEFITAYMTEREEKKAERKAAKKDQELGIEWDYNLHEIIRRDDGGAVLIAEQYYMYAVTTCTTNPNGGQTCRTTYHYIYNDIIAVNIDPQGNIEWSAKVPKRQHTVNDDGYYSSYALEVKGDKIYLIFNDTGENLFLKPGDKIKQFEFKGKDALVTIATIDGDGNTKREALFSPERRETILRPKDCEQMDDDRMFIYSTRKKEYRFGVISFK